MDWGAHGEYEVSFLGCLENGDLYIGRGRLVCRSTILRLEKDTTRVKALCSSDDKGCYSVGSFDFPVEDPVEIGLFAVGNINRAIYYGAFPEGSAIRFRFVMSTADYGFRKPYPEIFDIAAERLGLEPGCPSSRPHRPRFSAAGMSSQMS